MKKVLALGTLVSLILASLLSGTLAIYSKTVDIGSGSIVASSARSFVFLIEGTQNFQSTLKIAPTETVVFIFDLRNYDGAVVSETAMHYDLTIDISPAPGKTAITPLIVSIKNEDEQVLDTLTGTGTFQFSNNFLFSATGLKDTYIVEFYWPSTDNDIDFEGDDYSTRLGVSATATQIVQPALPPSFIQAAGNSLASRNEFLTKSAVWTYGSASSYDTASWSGYIEKLWEKGSGNDNRSGHSGKNKIKYSNPISGKQALFSSDDWSATKSSSPSYIPPAIIITCDPNLAPGSPYIIDNVDSLEGSVVVYKTDSSPVSETVVYYIDESGIPSPPRFLVDLLS